MAETFTPEPIGPTLGFLASQRTFVILLVGFCLTTYTNYATSAWIPPFLARVHHLSSAEIGTYAGTFKGLCGIAGTLLGGFVVAQIGRRDDRWKLWAPAVTSGLAGPVFALCMLTQDFTPMVAALAATSFLVGFHLGPIFAIAQTVAKPSMRALASAIMLLTAAGFGQGIGPLAVGMLNDALKSDFGARPYAIRCCRLRSRRRSAPCFSSGQRDQSGTTFSGPADPIRSRSDTSSCFGYCFERNAPRLCPRPCGRGISYVIYITMPWRKTGQKPSE